MLVEEKVVTCSEDGFERTLEKLANLSRMLVEKIGVDYADVLAVGVGSPGVVDGKKGIVLRWSNYDWNNVPFVKTLSQYQSSILFTIGTGIGGGIVFDGKLIEGYRCAGAELGHITIREGGLPCACGRRGCYEKYASTTALIKQTRHAMVENLESKMWKVADGKIENVSGRTRLWQLVKEMKLRKM